MHATSRILLIPITNSTHLINLVAYELFIGIKRVHFKFKIFLQNPPKSNKSKLPKKIEKEQTMMKAHSIFPSQSPQKSEKQKNKSNFTKKRVKGIKSIKIEIRK